MDFTSLLNFPILRMVRRTPSSSERVIVDGITSWGTSGYALSVR